MAEAQFILSKSALLEQVRILNDMGLEISYSYKTNHEVGDLLQELCPEVDYSIHAKQEIPMITDSSKISFFTQAESVSELQEILSTGIRSFVIDNTIDLERILEAITLAKVKIDLSIRMKFQEHRIGTGKYFVYGLPALEVNDLILATVKHLFIEHIGVHIHRKSQNTSEWEILEELQDSLSTETLKSISFLNMGGGLPSRYKSYTANVMPYITEKLMEAKEFLDEHDIKMIIEPGRFLAAPAVTLETEVKQLQGKNIILNTTLYNCALDALLTGTKMLVEGELDDSEDGEYYLLKGNSPTRDDIFRYRVKLKDVQIGDTIRFLYAGAYNYTTDFFGYTKLKTVLTE
ncbi:MAG: ornithine decarboxylase [Patescibacteria group bacterium]|jgi:ornithine decarboxylase